MFVHILYWRLLVFTMSLSWFCPECKACRTLWDSRISCLSLCFPNATAPLVTIIISLPWFCSMATCRTDKDQNIQVSFIITFNFFLTYTAFSSHIDNNDQQKRFYLFYYRSQPTQCQAALISTCYYSTPQLHYYAFGLLQLTAMGKGLPMGTWEWDCREQHSHILLLISMQLPSHKGLVTVVITSGKKLAALTFSLGKRSDGDTTAIWLPVFGWQARAQGQPGKHCNDWWLRTTVMDIQTSVRLL